MAMGPAKKKKKSAMGVDFKRVKHKVGRKLPPAANETKINVKSKSIVVLGQSIAQERDGLAVSSRRQTLKELFMQTSHHNENVRKEALVGIKDLISRHPSELTLHAVSIVEKLLPRITDSDKSVRQALIQVFCSTIFQGLSQALIGPILPLVMAYLSSATTHLSLNIRVTAFKLLDSLVHCYPSLIASRYLCQVVRYFVDFLKNVDVLGQGDRILSEVISILANFLSTVLLNMTAKESNDIFRSPEVWNSNQMALPTGTESTFLALHWYKSYIPEHGIHYCVPGKSNSNGTINSTEALGSSLLRVLLICWTRCCPFVCSGQTPDSLNLACMISISQAIQRVLQCANNEPSIFLAGWKDTGYGMVSKIETASKLARWAQEEVIPALCRTLLPSFPICSPLVGVPKKVLEDLVSLNVGTCEVMLRAFGIGGDQVDKYIMELSCLYEYMEGALHGRMLPSSGFSTDVIDKHLFERHVKRLLSLIPSFLLVIDEDGISRLLKAFTNVFQECKAASSIKLACLSSIAEMLLPNKLREGMHYCVPMEFQRQWLQELPRLLWELKHTSPSSSLAVLQVLHHIGRSAPSASYVSNEFTGLQSALIPFFCVSSSVEHKVKRLFGPFIRLPAACQQLAIDSLYYFDNFSSVFLGAVASCCLRDELDTATAVRCVEVVQMSFKRGSIKLPDYISFLVTLVVGYSSTQGQNSQMLSGISPGDVLSDISDAGLKKLYKHKALVGAVCSSLVQVGDGSLVLDLIEPSLCTHMAFHLLLEVSYGLARVVAILGSRGSNLVLPKSLAELLPQFVTNHLILVGTRLGLQGGDSIATLSKSFILPCLSLLLRSERLTGLVVIKLCSSLSKALESLDTENKYFVKVVTNCLLQVFDQKLAQAKALSKFPDDKLLQTLKAAKLTTQQDLQLQEMKPIIDELLVAAKKLCGG